MQINKPCNVFKATYLPKAEAKADRCPNLERLYGVADKVKALTDP